MLTKGWWWGKNKIMENLHHSNIIIGGDCRDFIFEILADKLNFSINANPDFLLVENQILGIGEVRDFERWVIGKPLIGEVKVSLIIIKSITFEAQNALLKVLEEPPLGTYIFINLESLGGLLPTFLSRVRVLELPKGVSKGHPLGQDSSRVTLGEKTPFGNEAQNFLYSKIKEKLSIIKSFSKKEDKNEMKELIKNMEEIAYKNNFKPEDLKNILSAKIFASARGSSPKMLLEWLSCVL
jgi:DNA polymerase III delta prime subunit